jgi:hypothetical protein
LCTNAKNVEIFVTTVHGLKTNTTVTSFLGIKTTVIESREGRTNVSVPSEKL